MQLYNSSCSFKSVRFERDLSKGCRRGLCSKLHVNLLDFLKNVQRYRANLNRTEIAAGLPEVRLKLQSCPRIFVVKCDKSYIQSHICNGP